MRPRMREVERQRGLWVAPLLCLYAGLRAAKRTAPIGADGEPGSHATAVTERNRDIGVADRYVLGLGRDPCERWNIPGAAFERRQQTAVLDVVGEGFKTNFGGVETHLRCAQQPRRVV